MLEIVKENKKQKEMINKLEEENTRMKLEIEFLTKRENKLQEIEQMFRSGTVDLSELEMLIRGLL